MKDSFVEGLVLDGRFESISPLNHGSFGMVFLAKDLTTDDQVAIKCLTKASTTDVCPAACGNDHLLELACHARLGYHPNIVNLLHAFETDTHMYLVLEFCSMGDLYEAIRIGRGPLETEHVRAFMLQLVDAVDFMHSKGLYHRDIKPENIFLTQDGSMKLGDFGLSTTETLTHESSVGSDRYMAPEQYDPPENGYSPAHADIWAIGICLLNILFSRNPFVTPSESDVLFADYVRDKQSLFDIFPNMSQDTFEVLVHAMSIDPEKRNLAAVREALQRVLTFTTDDEIFDDFCTEDREVVPASSARPPLRTPSIQSPPVEQGGAFPWAKALHMSPPRTSRQLSAIPDTEIYQEDMCSVADKDLNPWYSTSEQTPSLASVLDSALSASVKSMHFRAPAPRNPPCAVLSPLSGSLPAITSKSVSAMSTVFGNKDNKVSKSWSDLCDEDEEEVLIDTRRAFNGLNWSQESIDDDPTIRRNGSAEVEASSPIDVVTRNADNESRNKYYDGVNEKTGLSNQAFKTANKMPTYSPPSKRSILDKWVVLGNRRRAFNQAEEKKPEHGSQDGSKNGAGRKLSSTGGSWRGGFSMKAYSGNAGNGVGFGGGFWERKDKDTPNAGVKVKDWRRENSPHQYRYGRTGSNEDDDADIEWVGGWHDLHL